MGCRGSEVRIFSPRPKQRLTAGCQPGCLTFRNLPNKRLSLGPVEADSEVGRDAGRIEKVVEDCGLDVAELQAIGIAAQTLAEIHADYLLRLDMLRKHGEFIVQMLPGVSAAHSLKLRVKDPVHLLQKLDTFYASSPVLHV